MKKDRPESQAAAAGETYDLKTRRSDEEIRAGLRRRRAEVSPEVEDMSRRVRESETISAEDLAVVINAIPD